MNKLILLVSGTLFLFSCTQKPVKVIVDKAWSQDSTPVAHKIIFDGKDTFQLGDSSRVIELEPGKHSFVLDKQPAREFTVGAKGGLLNLDNQEYVAYEIEYEAKTSSALGNLNMNSMAMKSVVLIDSFVVIPKTGIPLASSDSMLRKILPKLMVAKNGNFYGIMGKEIGEYDINDQVHGLKRFGKDRLFIDAFWDYGPGEDIPETVEIRTTKYQVGTASTTKVAVLHKDMFLLVARLSEEEYIVKSLSEIREGNNDKVKDKERENAQMKF